MNERIITLRIKKIYFDAILSGDKSQEFRSVKPFYERLFESGEKPTHVVLHYQSPRKLKARIVEVRKIKRPKFLEESGIEFTEKVFRVILANPRLI